jgi:hypothetical protein
VRPGLVVLSAGALIDALYHAAPDSPLGGLLGPDGSYAHLVIFAGMLIVLASVLLQGVRRPGRVSPEAQLRSAQRHAVR